MKRRLHVLLVISIFIFIGLNIGCSKREYNKEDIYNDFQKQISKINGYTCISNLTVVGDKVDNFYIFKETYSKSNFYKIEIKSPEQLKGKRIEYKQNIVNIINPSNNDTVKLNNIIASNNNIFLGNFINNYKKDKLANLKIQDECLELEVDIPGENEYFNKQILYINIRNKTPEKMEIINRNKEVIFLVTYENFEYN